MTPPAAEVPGGFQPGSPTDRRPARRVSKLHQGPLGDFEGAAARVVARLTGKPVIIQDDGSRDSMVDIRIDYQARDPGFVEVWTDVDPGYAATYSSLMGRGYEVPLRIEMAALRRNWYVTVSGASQLRTLERELEELLGGLEEEALTFEMVADQYVLESNPNPSVERLVELGVVTLSSQLPSNDKAVVRLYPEGITGPARVAWDPVLDWLGETLASGQLHDVRAKLLKTAAIERHLFVGVTFTSPGEVFFALSDLESTLPDRPPTLPHEITHLWLMNAPPVGRCLAWFPRRGWFDVSRHWKTQ
jgi:hypothetical protein